MPEERRVQAEAELRGRLASQGSSGSSVWLVLGIVLLAASLVGVGAAVIFQSLQGSSGAPQAPTPTPARATPGVVIVGRQENPASGGSPATTDPTPAPGPSNPQTLATPVGAGGPAVFGPGNAQPPVLQPAPQSPPATDPGSPPSPGASQSPSPDTGAAAQPSTGASPGASPGTTAQIGDERVELALASLQTVEDKVGQLLLLAWIGNTAEGARPALQDLRAGGIVFVQNASTAADATVLNQGLKQIARDANLLPPLLAIDHEGGIVQRIKDVRNEGNNWTFGQGNPSDLQACERGARHAEVLRRLGFNMNLAPVLDVNNNPNNPVIGVRSYSDNPQLVARLGAAYIKGLQGGGIAAVGKHFPGHGNTSVDSHLGLPSLPQTIDDLDRIELVPFRRAIEADVAGIMSAHIVFPALDPSGEPATLSAPVMTGLLRERLGFRGLAVTDDLGAMKAITDNYSAGDAAVLAVKAGVDLLIMSSDVPRQRQARDALVAAVRGGEIPAERLDEAVRHVLQVKARFGLLGGPAQTAAACP